MPYGVLRFKLPEEAEEFKEAQNAGKWRAVVLDLDQHLRNRLKYEEEMPSPAREALEEARHQLHAFVWDAGLEL